MRILQWSKFHDILISLYPRPRPVLKSRLFRDSPPPLSRSVYIVYIEFVDFKINILTHTLTSLHTNTSGVCIPSPHQRNVLFWDRFVSWIRSGRKTWISAFEIFFQDLIIFNNPQNFLFSLIFDNTLTIQRYWQIRFVFWEPNFFESLNPGPWIRIKLWIQI